MEYELYHHGVKGQKWGVRRYQNADGSLTPLGKKKIQVRDDYLDKNGNLTEYGKRSHQVYDSTTKRYRNAKSIDDIVESERANDRAALKEVTKNYEWHKKNRNQYDDQDLYDLATADYKDSIKRLNSRINESMSKSVKRVTAELRESDRRKVDDAVKKYYDQKVANRKLATFVIIGAACIGGRIVIDRWASSNK